MTELIDKPWQAYNIDVLERYKGSIKSDVEVIKEDEELVHAKIANFEVAIKMGVEGEVLAKCTCDEYKPEKPCWHIVGVYRKSFKPKLEEDYLKKLLEEEEDEKEEVKVVEREVVSDIYARMKKQLYGKLVVLFGRPMVGKTTFAMKFAKAFLNVALLKIDKNYDAKAFGLREDQVYEVYSPKQLLYYIDKLEPKEDMIVIVDSITSMDSFFVPEDPTKEDPRVNNRRARFCDAVLQRLQKFKQKGVVIVIAHEAIKNFKTGEIGPRMNIVAMRHADALLHATIENGKRKIKRVIVREIVKEPEFDVEGF